MWRRFLATAAVCISISSFQASGTVHLEDGVKYYVNTWAVELHEELDLQQVTDIAEQHGMVNHGQVRPFFATS